MTETIVTAKSFMLGIAIMIGIAAQCGKGHAADTRTAVLAGGCFWCVEADFEKVDGVIEVVSGYTGGTVRNPTYRQVVRGGTGHYEAVEITYDADQISYAEILDLFFRSVDPTDAGGQFCDRGESYRTAIFTNGNAEESVARLARQAAEAELGMEIVTPILDQDRFYVAEEYHQDYYKKSEIILTRFGPRSKAEAYKRYRKACGRDQRVRDLWGSEAPFAG